MSLSDDVRSYCKKNYIDAARKNGIKFVAIRSGDVHKALNFNSQYPLVCSAIGSDKFEEACKIRRVFVEGPLNGGRTIFTFELIQ